MARKTKAVASKSASNKEPPKPASKEDLMWAAQELIWDAFDIPERRQKLALARKALKIFADCADGYVILAQHARTYAQRIELYRKGVQAGERALGKTFFKRNAGHFWGILETRGYMRALCGLANELWDICQYEEAITHWRTILRLNRDDNIGVRYVLAARLLYLDRDREAWEVIQRYKKDVGCDFAWIRPILLFREFGDDPRTRAALAMAMRINAHVPTYLFLQKPIPREIPQYVTWGGEDEAAECACDLMRPWRSTQGAIVWLEAQLTYDKPALLN
jgi:tetratricopeptide (TPR) repeat protein